MGTFNIVTIAAFCVIPKLAVNRFTTNPIVVVKSLEYLETMYKAGQPEFQQCQKPCVLGEYRRLIGWLREFS
jgi:hypothetical protein